MGETPATKPTGVEMADPQDVSHQGTNADIDFGLKQVHQNDPHDQETALRPTGEQTAALPEDPAP